MADLLQQAVDEARTQLAAALDKQDRKQIYRLQQRIKNLELVRRQQREQVQQSRYTIYGNITRWSR